MFLLILPVIILLIILFDLTIWFDVFLFEIFDSQNHGQNGGNENLKQKQRHEKDQKAIQRLFYCREFDSENNYKWLSIIKQY